MRDMNHLPAGGLVVGDRHPSGAPRLSTTEHFMSPLGSDLFMESQCDGEVNDFENVWGCVATHTSFSTMCGRREDVVWPS